MCIQTMFSVLLSLLIVTEFVWGRAESNPLDVNLAYRSPLAELPDLGMDTAKIHKRHVEAFTKRQVQSAQGFKDEHYPTFYGGEFGNAPFIWSAGINFTHAVASGDPLSDSVLLWTRAEPLPSDTPSNPSSTPFLPDASVPVCVRFEISPDRAFKNVVDSGTAFTSYDVDFTVKVEAKGLKPDTVYFYRFSDCTNIATVSPVGKTRTFATPNTPAGKVNGGKPLTFGVFSCSQYQAGYFNAYHFAALNITPDAYIHLGDYIYESLGNGRKIGRAVLGRALATIHDYRQRYNQYRTDIGLQTAHLSGPWFTVWDDHEVANNAWKAGTSNSNDTAAGCQFSPSGACFTDRKLAAIRAYHEWLPIRTISVDDRLRIWRNFEIGKLLDLTMLDTRNYDRDITDVGYNKDYLRTFENAEQRSIMGPKQENWFYDTMSASKHRGAVWRVVRQQVVFTQVNNSNSFSLDNWSGYSANRNRILNHLYSNNIDNTVVLAGDSHANWVSDLAHPNDTTSYNPVTGKGAIGVEFAGTAVTSSSGLSGGSPEAADATSRILVSNKGNEDLQWAEGFHRGFFSLSITASSMNATYYGMKNISNPNLDGFAIANFTVLAGENRLHRPVAGGSVLAGALKLVP